MGLRYAGKCLKSELFSQSALQIRMKSISSLFNSKVIYQRGTSLKKIIHNFQKKYLFQVKDLHVATEKIVENGELKGLVFQRTQIEGDYSIAIMQ